MSTKIYYVFMITKIYFMFSLLPKYILCFRILQKYINVYCFNDIQNIYIFYFHDFQNIREGKYAPRPSATKIML